VTVCLASFAAKGKAIVMVSDKAVTYGDDEDSSSSGPMQYDTGVKKLKRIGRTFWYALIAGEPTFAIDVVDGAEQIIAQNPELSASVTGMMACLKASYKKRREALAADRILSPRMLTRDLLVARTSDLLPLDQEFFFGVSAELKNLKTRSSLLVCGFDSKGLPHIFSIVNPGIVNSHDLTGFHAVGIGAKMAISRLLVLESRKEDKLELSLYQAFDAKVNAEITQGVGYNWDAEVLVSGHSAINVPDRIARMIERAYEGLPLVPFADGKKKAQQLVKEFKMSAQLARPLSQFAESVLAKAKPPRSAPRKSNRARGPVA
jgi:hypothetical protein